MPKKVTTEELLIRAKKNEERARLAREEYDRRIAEENKILLEILFSSYEKLLDIREKEIIAKRLSSDLRKALKENTSENSKTPADRKGKDSSKTVTNNNDVLDGQIEFPFPGNG